MANTTRAVAQESRAPPVMSGFAADSSLGVSLKTCLLKTNAPTPIGKLIKKAQRQLASSMIPAPMAGPKALAEAKQAPQRVTAVALRSDGHEAITSPIEAGVIKAAPTPCKARIAIRKNGTGAAATPMDASTNTANPKDITRKRPARSASRPLTTSNAA